MRLTLKPQHSSNEGVIKISLASTICGVDPDGALEGRLCWNRLCARLRDGKPHDGSQMSPVRNEPRLFECLKKRQAAIDHALS
jgi:hypothetical protein